MIDTGALRKEIINLAVQGKLVSQKSGEGATEDIYDLLRKKGKKTFADILEENMSFSIPNSWRWGTLSDLTFDNELNDGNWILKEDMVDFGPVKLIQLGNIGDCKYIEKGYKYLTEEHFLELNGRQIYPGYLLINRLVVKDMYSCIIPDVKGILMTAVDVCWVAPNIEHYNIEYIMYALSSNDFRNKVQSLGHGVTRFRISKTNLINIAFPIPPISEQNRIVKKIKELFKLLDQIDALQTQYSSDLEVLKSKIIDAGIQGKLTEQIPEDGTAEELLEQITEEKKQLVKERKIKASKSLPEITEDEIPFEIPENWKWVRIADVFTVINGDRGKNYPAKNTLMKEGVIPFISAINIDGHSVVEDDNMFYLSEEQYEKLSSGKMEVDDVIVCIRGSLGKHGLNHFEKGAIASSLIICRASYKKRIMALYLMNYLKSGLFVRELRRYNSGVAQPNLAANNFEKFLFPLPPILEQERIVSRIDDAVSMCQGGA